MNKTRSRPPWWPQPSQKIHADAACGHPDYCNVSGGDTYTLDLDDTKHESFPGFPSELEDLLSAIHTSRALGCSGAISSPFGAAYVWRAQALREPDEWGVLHSTRVYLVSKEWNK